MHIKLIVSTVIAALLLTGTAYSVSQIPGQGAQLQQPATTTAPAASTAPVVSTVPAATTAPAAATTLTEDQAILIALNHAGLTSADVTGLRARKDMDDRIAQWDIEWRSGDWEYDCSINMETGAILEWDRDYDPSKRQSPPATTAPAATAPAATGPVYLTAEEAKTIALKHAGLTESQVSFLRTEFDRDDGVPEWEVEFDFEGFEYHYEIHAETGKIREQDKDWDD